MKGYSLIELLVVIAIMGILGTVGYVNYLSFSASQSLADGVNKVQSFLRTAQTNATASVVQNGSTCFNWSVKFSTDRKTLSLFCETEAGDVEKEPALTLPATITVDAITLSNSIGITCTAASFPTNTATVVYGTLYGHPSFILGKDTPDECPDPDSPPVDPPTSMNIIVKYTKGSTELTKEIVTTVGGQIDVR